MSILLSLFLFFPISLSICLTVSMCMCVGMYSTYLVSVSTSSPVPRCASLSRSAVRSHFAFSVVTVCLSLALFLTPFIFSFSLSFPPSLSRFAFLPLYLMSSPGACLFLPLFVRVKSYHLVWFFPVLRAPVFSSFFLLLNCCGKCPSLIAHRVPHRLACDGPNVTACSATFFCCCFF